MKKLIDKYLDIALGNYSALCYMMQNMIFKKKVIILM